MIGFGRKFIARFRGDPFQVRATAIVILLFVSVGARADWDLGLSGTFRSYPLGGGLELDGGYGIPLWGENSSGNPWYGYLRPHVAYSTSGYYNAVNAALDFYPLSFLGGSVGGEAIENDENYTAFDCSVDQCRGRFYRKYAMAEATAGAGIVIFQFRYRRDIWSERTPTTGRFVEPVSALALSGGGDGLTTYRGTVGLRVTPQFTVLGILIYAKDDAYHEISRFPFAVIRYVDGPLSLGIGGGAFSSSIKPMEGTVMAFFGWELKPSLALH